MIQLIQVQHARMKGANQFPNVSLRLTAVRVTTRVALDAADVRKLETFALTVYHYGTATAWITNISGIHLSRATRPPLTTILPMFSRIYWQIQHCHMPIKSLSQLLLLPSPFLTSLFPTLSLYLIAVGVTTRVAVNAADVSNLKTFAQVVYRYSAAIVWITNVVGIHLSWAIWPPLMMKLPTFPQINWQARHRQIPVNLLRQPLILPSPFLTTISMTLVWIQSPVATRRTLRSQSPYNLLPSLLFIWCPTPPSSGETRTLLLCWN